MFCSFSLLGGQLDLRLSPIADFTCREVPSPRASIIRTVDRKGWEYTQEEASLTSAQAREVSNAFEGSWDALSCRLLHHRSETAKGSARPRPCSGAHQCRVQPALGQLTGQWEAGCNSVGQDLWTGFLWWFAFSTLGFEFTDGKPQLVSSFP